MKITFDRLFKLPLSDINTYILYGNDESVIERALAFLKETYAASHSMQLLDTPDNVSAAPSLFDSVPRPILSIIRTSSEKIIRTSAPQGLNVSIFIAPNLRAKSPLIMESQSQSEMCTISCYECGLLPEELMFMAKAKGLSLTHDQLRVLYNAFKSEPEWLSNCLSILAISGTWNDSEFVTLLESLLQNDSGMLLLSALLEKNIPAFDQASEVELDPETLIPTLRMLTRSFEILLSQKIELSKPPHPVFFKDQPLFQSVLKKWSLNQIRMVLKVLLKLEDEVKFKQISPYVIQQHIRACLHFRGC